MMPQFADELAQLSRAIRGLPVDWSVIKSNYFVEHRNHASANLPWAPTPAWGLDALRRGDKKVVEAVLSWLRWVVTQPLHQSEPLVGLDWYRERIIRGTYASALLARMAGDELLCQALLDRCRKDIAWLLLGTVNFEVKSLVNDNPPDWTIPHLLIADGPTRPMPGLPCINGGAGARALFRKIPKHGGHGEFYGIDYDTHRILIAQALSLPYKTGENSMAKKDFDVLHAKGLPSWGLSESDVALAKAFVKEPGNAEMAREIAAWTLPYPPESWFEYRHHKSGAVSVICWEIRDAVNKGDIMVCVVLADGTRMWGSADLGMTDGAATERQVVIETPEFLTCHWANGKGVDIHVPNPLLHDPIVWSWQAGGNSVPTFWPGQVVLPPAPPPVVKPPKEKVTWKERFGI